jgi:hypothetical protein
MDGSTLLAGRYRFLRWIPGGANYFIWLARDEATGGVVVVSPLPVSRVLLLEPTVGVVHPRLAAIRQIIHDFDPALLPERRADSERISAVVAERLAGKTLYDVLPKGVVPPVDAVAMLASLCSPIAAMHRRGGAHGAISARSVVVERVDGGPNPAFSQILVPPDGLYCSPERISGGGASALDDSWALFVTLYTSLTGQRPFRGKTRIEITRAISGGQVAPLTDSGINDRDLQFLFDRGFSPELSHRMWRVEELREALLAWLRRNAPDRARSDEKPSLAPSTVSVSSRSSESIPRAVMPTIVADAPNEQLGDQEVPHELQQAVVATPSSTPRPTSVAARSSSAILSAPVVALGHVAEPSPRVDSAIREARSIVPKTLPPPIDRLEPESSAPPIAAPPQEDSPPPAPQLSVVLESEPSSPAPASEPSSEESDTDSSDSIADTVSQLASAIQSSSPPPSFAAETLPQGAQPELEGEQSNPEPQGELAAEISSYAPLQASTTEESTLQRESTTDLETASNLRRSDVPLPSYTPHPSGGSRRTWLAVGAGLCAVFVLSGLVARLFFAKDLSTRAKPSSSLARPNAGENKPIASSTQATRPSASASASAASTRASTAPTASASSAPPAVAALSGDSNACVHGFFPSESFRSEVNLSFVCTENDVRKGIEKIRTKLVVAAGGQLTTAMNEWPRLGWYQLAVYGMLRKSCCVDAEPLSLPLGPSSCESMVEIVGGLAESFRNGAGVEAARERFETGATCYQNTHVKGYSYPTGPFGGSQLYFSAFLERNQKK